MTEISTHIPNEAIEKQIKIKTPEKLASALGFTRSEGGETWYKIYHKEIAADKNVLLIFQNNKYGGEQRIILGVGGKEYFLSQDAFLAEKVKQLGLGISEDNKMFFRKELNEGGYQKLFGFLSDLEAGGFYEDPIKFKLSQDSTLSNP